MIRFVVTLALGVVCVWFVWDGLSSLIALPEQYSAYGFEDQIPWAILWVGVLMPVVVFMAAAVGARSLAITAYTLVLIVALCVIATTRLSLIAAAGAALVSSFA